ncbi:hypothetical protein HU755_18885 [Pseudomonas sp. SWRI111]|uniref:hypothetical protein n=1 Tax=Pseudomonas sp. SWRI111 TaxID=2745507 RepID=UPI0016480343|nr:hypothetical protein [Pseudomonas sp. SWRI111]MBC3208873.1 hypothetical protein [Pseudomonas sp. SWRI111]
MTYQLTACGVLRTDDSAFIPADPTNRDWLEYQDWLLSGGQVQSPQGALGETVEQSTAKTLANKWLTRISRQP